MAPSTTPLDSAWGRAGTGMPTGSAPQASSTQAPVRDGMRIFRFFRSSGPAIFRSTMWIAWPAWVCTRIGFTSL